MALPRPYPGTANLALPDPPSPAPTDAPPAPEGPETGAPGPDPTLVHLRVRLQGVLDALTILDGVAPEDDLLGPIRMACEALAPEVANPGAAVVPMFRRPLPDDLEGFERDLGRVEQAILAADAAIPMLLFRKRFDARDLPRPALARYAALLAANLGTDAERRDRVEMLVTRMVTVETPGGLVRLEDRSRVWSLLRQVTGARQMAPEARDRVLRYLADQGERLSHFKDSGALFEEGFYANVYGYKLALREQMLDPQVLYAIAWLNAAVTNFNRLHAPDSEAAIHARAKAVRQEVHGVFHLGRNLEQAATTQRFEVFRDQARAQARVQVLSAKGAGLSAARPARRAPLEIPWRRVVQVLAVGLVVFGGAQVVHQWRATHRYQQITEDQARALAPWVEAASRDPDDGTLLGTVDPALWQALAPRARRQAGEALAQDLSASGTLAALLTSNGHPVLQIDGGRVVYVQ